MRIKSKFSLSLKLTLTVVSLSAIVVGSITVLNITQLGDFVDSEYLKKASFLGKSIDAGIEIYDELNNTEKLQEHITRVNDTNSDLLSISVNLFDDEELKVIASSNRDAVGKSSSKYCEYWYEAYLEWLKDHEKDDANDKDEGIIVFVPPREGALIIIVMVPVNAFGKIVGTYEMSLYMKESIEFYNKIRGVVVFVAIISFFCLIFSFLYLLRRIIVSPIVNFRNAAKKIGKGYLDEKIEVKARDELGELATAFNKMTVDLKKSRNKIEQYNKTLENLLDQKDEFIGQLGHDLKNPLTPLVGLLPMIIEQEKNPALKKHLQLISHNVEYMRELIFKTLELAKLRSSDTNFDFEKLNLRSELKDILNIQQHVLGEKHMITKNKIKDNMFVEADKLRLAEIFTNLITNAIKYTSKDYGVITIDAKEERDFVTVSVNDTGIGMTKEETVRVFDEFYMGEDTGHRTDSSGLGLSICKRIVEKHGGRIWVESPGKGNGSTFYFTLKLFKEKSN